MLAALQKEEENERTEERKKSNKIMIIIIKKTKLNEPNTDIPTYIYKIYIIATQTVTLTGIELNLWPINLQIDAPI